MNLFKNSGLDHGMQVCLHEIKDQVNVSVVYCLYYLSKLDDVFVRS